MKNIKTELKDSILTIQIDTSKELGASKSGKSILIASTQGNQKIMVGAESISIGINCYKSIL